MTKFYYLGSVPLRVKVLQIELECSQLFGCPTANFESLPKGVPRC